MNFVQECNFWRVCTLLISPIFIECLKISTPIEEQKATIKILLRYMYSCN
jgi:hypothetical protein